MTEYPERLEQQTDQRMAMTDRIAAAAYLLFLAAALAAGFVTGFTVGLWTLAGCALLTALLFGWRST